MKHKILIFGTGSATHKFLDKSDNEDKKNIIGFVDNAKEKWGTEFYDKVVYSPDEIKNLDYTLIINCSIHHKEIQQQLAEMGIPNEKIKKHILEFNNSKVKQLLLLNETAKKLENKNFSLISNYCWGAFIYRFFETEYYSPFIGTLMYDIFYDKLLQNFNYYINQPLKLQLNETQNHLEGYLDDVKLFFFYENNPKIALEKWNRRVERINYDNLFFHWGDYGNKNSGDFLEKYDFENKLSISCDKAFIHSKEKTIITKEPVDLVAWFNKKL